MNLFLIILVVFYSYHSIKILKETERGAVFRLGLISKVVGPGPVFIMFPIEMMVKIDLNKHIPEWQGMLKEELNEKIKQKILSGEISGK